ncbi:MAG TPA: hypothetical protein VN380_03835 [Thermoanaerobaculia bacterium]|jgi:hypothetical protein|nr:hypothetical protein [Thermoanaerobaculia bacterium]
MPLSATRLRQVAALTAAAGITFIVARHLLAVHGVLQRALDSDETELLHAGWLMRSGLRLYRDFCEDHTPFLLTILRRMVPEPWNLASYISRARLFSGACGLLAAGAAATLAYRISRGMIAPLVTLSALLASPWVWYRGLNDVRNDPPAIFLFWLGALFLLGRWQSERLRLLLAGIGIGLVATAALWNPKWPLESLVLGIIYLAVLWRARSVRNVALAVIPPLACVAASITWIVAMVPLRDYVFFSFRLNQLFMEWFMHRQMLTRNWFNGGVPYMYCDPAFRGIAPIAVIAAAAIVTRRSAPAALLVLAAAATAEIRFIYPYPNVWPQYYLMWSFIAACLYGITAARLLDLASDRAAAVATIAVTVVCAMAVHVMMPISISRSGSPIREHLQRKLRAGETVWMLPPYHPIGVRDAGYYWFAIWDLVPFSIAYTKAHPGATPLPVMTESDLPVCRAERGLQPDLRFVSIDDPLDDLPESRRCLERLVASGRATRTIGDVWDLHPESRR